MCEPLVSVIIPVYNGADYLKEAIDSVLGQTYSNIELIIINDGSDDEGKTERIATNYGSKIRYFYKENGGVATALNMGISKMRGEYFAWLSHDDVFYPRKIEEQVAALIQENVKVTACAYHIMYDSGRRIPVPFVDFYGQNIIKNSVFSVLQALIQFGGVLLHKSVFERYGLFREDLKTTQDYEFLFRVLRQERCVFSNRLLYGIRYHDKQGSRTISSVNQEREGMYCRFMEELSKDEKRSMYGSEYCFYYQMLLRVWPMPNIERAIWLCVDELNHKEAEHFSKVEDSGIAYEEPILIYGAGIYGRRLLFDLRCRGIKVAGFLDGNRDLWGKEVDGIVCFSLQDVESGSVEGTIIIASIFREEIAHILREKGITSFCYKEDYECKAMRSAPRREKILEVISTYD